jgi:hypothetical protein
MYRRHDGSEAEILLMRFDLLLVLLVPLPKVLLVLHR